MDQQHSDDYLTVADAARLLGIGRNHMHRLPKRLRHRIWQTECYRSDELLAWQDALGDGPNTLLKELREKHASAQARRNPSPFTKTGKLKKSFLSRLRQRCPVCDGKLSYENHEDFANWFPIEEDAFSSETAIPRRTGRRHVPVEEKGRPTRYVTLDFDKENKKADAIAQAGPLELHKASANLFRASFPYCVDCQTVIDTDYLGIMERGAGPAAEPSGASRNGLSMSDGLVADDVLQMTSSTHRVEQVAWGTIAVVEDGDFVGTNDE